MTGRRGWKVFGLALLAGLGIVAAEGRAMTAHDFEFTSIDGKNFVITVEAPVGAMAGTNGRGI